MLPVSGAEQLNGSPPIGERPMVSQMLAYSRLVSESGKCFFGRNMFHRPAFFAFSFSSSMIGGDCQRSPPSSSWR